MLNNPGLYVHLPWCIRKCPYCDFNSHPLKADSDLSAYSTALLTEWHARKDVYEHEPVYATVFFGGGTPSLFPPEAFSRLLDEIPRQSGAEVTMEANPGTTEHMVFADYRHAGINRLSIGVQTFDDAALKRLGRIHSAGESKLAFAQARQGGFDNINIDLMWGLPGQTLSEALADLHTAIALEPDHISWYQLTIEPKTEFGARPPILPVEEHLLAMETEGLALLESAGYQRYEVSAYARDKPCRHNLNYWEFGDYTGLGAGAHGKESGPARIKRTQNPHQPRLYIEDPCSGVSGCIDTEELPFEFMLNALRLKDGVGFTCYTERTGLDLKTLKPVWDSLVARGLVRTDRCATTPLGYRYLDSVVAEFLR